jgi:hypothetical protein
MAHHDAVANEPLFPRSNNYYMGDNIPGKPSGAALLFRRLPAVPRALRGRGESGLSGSAARVIGPSALHATDVVTDAEALIVAVQLAPQHASDRSFVRGTSPRRTIVRAERFEVL